jgi:hypothetical protein
MNFFESAQHNTSGRLLHTFMTAVIQHTTVFQAVLAVRLHAFFFLVYREEEGNYYLFFLMIFFKFFLVIIFSKFTVELPECHKREIVDGWQILEIF